MIVYHLCIVGAGLNKDSRGSALCQQIAYPRPFTLCARETMTKIEDTSHACGGKQHHIPHPTHALPKPK